MTDSEKIIALEKKVKELEIEQAELRATIEKYMRDMGDPAQLRRLLG